jgi:hypothetical protein
METTELVARDLATSEETSNCLTAKNDTQKPNETNSGAAMASNADLKMQTQKSIRDFRGHTVTQTMEEGKNAMSRLKQDESVWTIAALLSKAIGDLSVEELANAPMRRIGNSEKIAHEIVRSDGNPILMYQTQLEDMRKYLLMCLREKFGIDTYLVIERGAYYSVFTSYVQTRVWVLNLSVDKK